MTVFYHRRACDRWMPVKAPDDMAPRPKKHERHLFSEVRSLTDADAELPLSMLSRLYPPPAEVVPYVPAEDPT